jgi:hypothetical protein
MLGRVLSGSAKPLDGGAEIVPDKMLDIAGAAINPWARDSPADFIETGISTIDGMNTLVRGQKLPIFSASGLPHNDIALQIARQAKVRGENEEFAVVFIALGITNEEKQKSYSINGSDNYNDWLKTGEGKKSYGFWNLQERILLGIDANPGKYIILGVAGGIQAYQGDSDYDDVREDLGDIGYIDNSDARNGFAPASAWWIGVRFGKNGKFGNFTIEFDDVYKGTIGDWVGARKYTYAHPTGFFLGVTEGDLISLGVFAGKQFVF